MCVDLEWPFEIAGCSSVHSHGEPEVKALQRLIPQGLSPPSTHRLQPNDQWSQDLLEAMRENQDRL